MLIAVRAEVESVDHWKEKFKTDDRNAWKKEPSLDMEYLLQPCQVYY